MEAWSTMLRDARLATGLSRAGLSERCGISAQTIKSYELGLRHPSRELLTVLLDELKTDRLFRNQILAGAGFAPDGDQLGPRNPDYAFSLDEAKERIAACAWPACVMTELMDVLDANALARQVWDVDLATEFTGPLERNMMTVATEPRFADRVINWEEMLSVGIARWKGHHRGPEDLSEGASAYFAAVMQRLFAGDPGYLQRLVALWDTVEPISPKVWWSYPVVWDHLAVGRLDFEVTCSPANERDGFYFHDWLPVNTVTWERLEQLRARPQPAAK
jgi:transcriptional regulator with XRE-family HTH domain